MTRELKFGRVAPVSGTAKSMVILLHGYGADANDLLGLADPLGQHMPDTVFIAPDAPEACLGNPMGRQWFPLPSFDGSTPEQAAAGRAMAHDDINAFVDKMLQEEGLAPDKTAIIGFSQGTMMMYDTIPLRDQAMAAMVGFSGRLLRPETLSDTGIQKVPVLLCHGDQDDVVPFDDMRKAGDALVKAGFETYVHVMKGMGHGISPDGLGAAFAFLSPRLSYGQA